MKNKIVLFGSLCLVLALGLVFVGCNNVQQVEFTSQGGVPETVTESYSAPTISWVTTSGSYGYYTYDNGKLTVNWDAVEGAGSYQIVISQDDKVTYYPIQSVSYGLNYNSNLDRWSVEIQTHTLVTRDGTFTGAPQFWTPLWPGNYKIGVVAVSRRNDQNRSDPVWASTKETFSDVVRNAAN